MGGLIRLCHHGWVIPLVVHLGQDRGARFAVLQNRLGVARPTLERALSAATRLALVMPNPGYGHPLRPEYLLTPWGELLAPSCEAVTVAMSRGTMGTDQEPTRLARRKWTLPVLASLSGGADRYSDLRRDLVGCTPRALGMSLDRLEEAGWIERHVVDDRPPRPSYAVTDAARDVASAALALGMAAR